MKQAWYLWLHPGVPADIVADPQLEVAHARHGVEDVVGVADIQGVGEVLELAVDVRPKRHSLFRKALQQEGQRRFYFPYEC